MLRKIVLHGRLAEQYTDQIELDADDLRMVVSGINSNYNGFADDFVSGEWHVLRGDPDNKDSMSTEEVGMTISDRVKVLHIFPRIEGEGGDGTLQVILGIVIIAGAYMLGGPAGFGATAGTFGGATITYGNIALFGLAMSLSGVAQMMAPMPELGDALAAERAQDKPSFMFNGATNVMVAGGPVPLVYGEFEVGSTVISAGINVEKQEI